MTTCYGCNRTIRGEYVTALGRDWHAGCFTCAGCRRPLEGSFIEHHGQPFHSECYTQRYGKRCAGCGQAISGEYVSALGKEWHAEHFVCQDCRKPFKGRNFYQKDGQPYCENCHAERFSPRCAGCGKPIVGSYASAQGKTWHTECFRCTRCRKPFRGKNFLEKNGSPYCTDCYHQQFSPRCSVCEQPMRSSYRVNFWGDRYCEQHASELAECYSCGRPVCERLTHGGTQYRDGRTVCGLCRPTAVDGDAQAANLLQEVRRKLNLLGIDSGRQAIPLRLVDQPELDRLTKRRRSKQSSGLTRTRIWTENGREVRRELEEVVILHGLPQEHFSAIAAHELGHVMLFNQGFDNLPAKVEEGLCELCSYLWLKQRGDRHADFRIDSMQKNDDSTYGVGFRQALKSYEKVGLRELLAYVKKNQGFP